MDENKTYLEILLTALLGGGGVAGLIAAIKSARAKQEGMPKDEGDVIREVGTAPDLIRYWKSEITSRRLEWDKQRAKLEREIRWYETRVDQLERWIWESKGPPPPDAPPMNLEGKR